MVHRSFMIDYYWMITLGKGHVPHQDQTDKGSSDVNGSKGLHTVHKERDSLQTQNFHKF